MKETTEIRLRILLAWIKSGRGYDNETYANAMADASAFIEDLDFDIAKCDCQGGEKCGPNPT